MRDTFKSRGVLKVRGRDYEIYRLPIAMDAVGVGKHLPYALKILLENLLRNEDGVNVKKEDIEALLRWKAQAAPNKEIAFAPARVLLQDFTGVPCIVDLAVMRDAIAALGGNPARINPLQPVELVIDHSVQVDAFGTLDAITFNTELEFKRNQERYIFLRWGQKAFKNFKVVPPGTGIVHQVNLEYLARVVFTDEADGKWRAYPDTLVGTDSHTTMINGLGVLGWGVGGIEAEAAMLGQSVSMLIPQVVGVRLTGRLPEGATATDLVLTVTELLRKIGVVGKFVEFFGPGLAQLPLADRATIANMAPEFGATCAIFPIDEETVRYLRLSGRQAEQAELVEAYAKAQGLWATADSPEAQYSQVLALDLGSVEPCIAGPKRPQDRVRLSDARKSFVNALAAPAKSAPINGAAMAASSAMAAEGNATTTGLVASDPSGATQADSQEGVLRHGSVVIAAITSCTNTSNPSVMLAAGLLAKKAVERGLKTKPWVKTSLAPGSQVVTQYLKQSGLAAYLEQLRFHTVGYGCTTCIGNSGPLPSEVSTAIEQGNLLVCSVLSGNRNFEGRVHPEVKANYLMSPPLVVAYALAGTLDIDLTREPIGAGQGGKPVYLKDIWPAHEEVRDAVARYVQSEMFQRTYQDVFKGEARWGHLPVPESERFAWDERSTYIKSPPYFVGMDKASLSCVADITGARVLAWLGDSVTTDHISPAGNIKKDSPAAKYLIEHGVAIADFNSYGARRGNHEVMMRGTFANVRLRNQLAPETEGGVTLELTTGKITSIYDAAMHYRQQSIPLIILAGKEYGSGSSRDWAAKGPALLGVRAVIAESFERIHRSNLVGMGILPLEFLPGENAQSLGLTAHETFQMQGLEALLTASASAGPRRLVVRAQAAGAKPIQFTTNVRIDTPKESQYYRHGGILPYVLRQLIGSAT